MNRTYTDLDAARQAHEDMGGYLLDLGQECEAVLNERTGVVIFGRYLDHNIYAVTDDPSEYGRTPEQIAEMDCHGWSEVLFENNAPATRAEGE